LFYVAGVLSNAGGGGDQAAGIPRYNLDSVSEPYIGDDFPQTAKPSGGGRLLELHQKIDLISFWARPDKNVSRETFGDIVLDMPTHI
jgi:hypothetical protein